MLDLFRQRGVMSFVYTALMGAVLVVFIIQFRPNSGSPTGSLFKKCAVKVRGDCIEEKDVTSQRFLLRGGQGDEKPVAIKVTLDSLIERTLLEQEADRLGIHVTEDDVVQELVRGKVYVMLPVAMRNQQSFRVNFLGFRIMPFGTKDKPFDQQMFELAIKQSCGLNVNEFTDQQMHELRAARVLNLVADRVRISDEEAWPAYQIERTTATIRYAQFRPAYFAKFFAAQDGATVEKWAADNAKAVSDREATQLPSDKDAPLLHLRHVLIDAKKDVATAEQKADAKKRADDILARVKAGEDFAKLARENSSDVGTKNDGGMYEWMTANGSPWPPEVKSAALELKPMDATLVETPLGYDVVQLAGRLEGKAAVAYPLYADARGDELAHQAADKVAAALKTQLPVVLDDALKAKIEEAKKTGKPEADATTQVIDDESRARVNKAIDDTLAAMAPPAPPAPAAKPADKAEGKPNEMKPGDAPTTAPVEVAKPEWMTDYQRPAAEESSAFNAGGSPINGLMDQQSIADAAMKLTKDAPMVGPIKASGDYLLVVLKDRHDVVRADFDKERAGFVGGMLGRKREDAIVNYVNALRDGLGKELTYDPKYSPDAKPADSTQPASQPPSDDDQPQN